MAPPLNPADAQVLEVAKLMASGVSFIEATKAIGVQWSVKTFQTNVARVLGRAAVTAAERAVLTDASAAAAGGGGAGILAGLAAWASENFLVIIGGIAGVVIIGGVAYYVYNRQPGNSGPPVATAIAEEPSQVPGGSTGGASGTVPSRATQASTVPSATQAGGATRAASASACPTQAQVRMKCPWTPDGYTVNPCGPGFCWDGGPQGSLACKQVKNPDGPPGSSFRNDLNNVGCNPGFKPVTEACTGVLLSCEKQ